LDPLSSTVVWFFVDGFSERSFSPLRGTGGKGKNKIKKKEKKTYRTDLLLEL
jgi:hypothetical protein